MAKQFPALDEAHLAFIGRQKIFFTASSTSDSRVNISPRGTDAFRILGPGDVAYLDLTGSGNETSAHLIADGRATMMFCSFEGPPLILRLYGRGRALQRGTPDYDALFAARFGPVEPLGARQIVTLSIDLVQTSCGYGVPLFEYQAERPTLDRWAQAKGMQGLEDYRRENNRISIDGLPTGLASAVESSPRTL